MHIPRTGGGTFWQMVLSLIPDIKIQRGTIDDIDYRLIINDKTAYVPIPFNNNNNCMYGHFPYHKSFKKHFLYTFVRNPIKMSLSRYTYHMGERNPQGRDLDLTYMEWITGQMPSSIVWSNMQTRYFGDATVDDFNFIGITERYDESVELFFKKLGIECPSWDKQKRKNKSKYTYTPTEEETEIVTKLNQKDIELYNKALEKFEKEI